MNPRLRTGIIAAVIGIVLILIGTLVVSLLFGRDFSPDIEAPADASQITTNAVITSHDLPNGTLLQENDLLLIEIPIELAPRNTINTIESAVGSIITSHLVKGEILLESNIADPTNIQHDIAMTIDADQVIMAFQPNDLMTSLSLIQRGDIIDIFASSNQKIEVVDTSSAGISDTEETILITFDAFQGVEITALVIEIVEEENSEQTFTTNPEEPESEQIQNAPPPKRENITIKSYLIALDPQDALILKFLKDSGANFDIVLRSPTSIQTFELISVSDDFIKERYQLEVLR